MPRSLATLPQGVVIAATHAHPEASEPSGSKTGIDKGSDCSSAVYREVGGARIPGSPKVDLAQSETTRLGFPHCNIIDASKPVEPTWKVTGAPQQNLTESISRDGKVNLDFKSAPDTQGTAAIYHKFGEPVADGQGLDVSMKINAEHAGKVSIELFQPQTPYAQTLNEEIDVQPGAQEIHLHGIAPNSPQGLSMGIKVDGKVGAVDFKDLSVTPTQAFQAEPPHYTTKDGRVIENTNTDTIVKSANGKSVEMRNGQPFLIGFEVQSLDPNDHSAGQGNIQSLLKNNADLATVTPYWKQYQNHPEQFKEKINWLEQQGIEIKEHPALWDQMIPSTDKYGKPLLVSPEMIKEHAQEISKLPGKLTEINETVDVSTAPNNAVTDWINKVGPAKATEQAIDWIRSADPNKTIIYNDFQDGAQERRMLDQLQRDNKLPDAIGIQMHMDQGNWPLPRVEETINKLAKYGKPIYITEISVLSGENGQTISQLNHDKIESMAKNFATISGDKNLTPADQTRMESLQQNADGLSKQVFQGNEAPVFNKMIDAAKELSDPALREKVMKRIDESKTWASTAEGEQRQADYTENLYKVLHNNPHVQGITYWDITDKNSWKGAPRGWYREDGTPKPVVARMEKLFASWRKEKID